MNEKKAQADKPVFEEGLQYHIECKPGDLQGPVFLPGDTGVENPGVPLQSTRLKQT